MAASPSRVPGIWVFSGGEDVSPEILFFFDRHLPALPLYEAFEALVLEAVPGAEVKVQKTQITFSNRHGFAFVSFLPARRAKDRPDPYITVTLGLHRRLDSPRVDQASEPYPGRWTHHLVIGSVEEIDGELMVWVREAYDFAASKR